MPTAALDQITGHAQLSDIASPAGQADLGPELSRTLDKKLGRKTVPPMFQGPMGGDPKAAVPGSAADVNPGGLVGGAFLTGASMTPVIAAGANAVRTATLGGFLTRLLTGAGVGYGTQKLAEKAGAPAPLATGAGLLAGGLAAYGEGKIGAYLRSIPEDIVKGNSWLKFLRWNAMRGQEVPLALKTKESVQEQAEGLYEELNGRPPANKFEKTKALGLRRDVMAGKIDESGHPVVKEPKKPTLKQAAEAKEAAKAEEIRKSAEAYRTEKGPAKRFSAEGVKPADIPEGPKQQHAAPRGPVERTPVRKQPSTAEKITAGRAKAASGTDAGKPDVTAISPAKSPEQEYSEQGHTKIAVNAANKNIDLWRLAQSKGLTPDAVRSMSDADLDTLIDEAGYDPVERKGKPRTSISSDRKILRARIAQIGDAEREPGTKFKPKLSDRIKKKRGIAQ